MTTSKAIVISGLIVLCGVGAPALADSFTLDPASPSWPVTEDIHNDWPGVGPGMFTVGLNRSTLGLMNGDVIDAISLGNDPIDTGVHGNHDHLFSVSRSSHGLTGSGVRGSFPFAGSDIFLWQAANNGTNIMAPVGSGWRGGVRDGSRGNTGLGPDDNVNGLESTTMTFVAPPNLPFEVYFSLQAGSATLGRLGATGADILAVGGFFGAVPVIYKYAAADLNIPAASGADVDALSMETIPDPGGGAPILVQVHFSVSRATTGWTYGGNLVDSGADILDWSAAYGYGIAWRPADSGLEIDDDIDALETIIACPTEDPQACPWDLNGDGMIDFSDLLQLISHWGACP